MKLIFEVEYLEDGLLLAIDEAASMGAKVSIEATGSVEAAKRDVKKQLEDFFGEDDVDAVFDKIEFRRNGNLQP
jgi:hypothetical protein